MAMTSLFLLVDGQILAGNLRNRFENRIEMKNIKPYLKTMDDVIMCLVSPALFALDSILVNMLIYIYTLFLFPSINDIYRVSNSKDILLAASSHRQTSTTKRYLKGNVIKTTIYDT